MEKVIYIVRHCSAEGQAPEVELTAKGILQAGKLVEFFEDIEVDRIITSPFSRARQTGWPLAERKKLHVEVDSRLGERVLSSRDFEDWLIKLEDTFLDLHLKYEGGESSNEAISRVCDVVDELRDGSRTVLVTHGNLMALLVMSYDERFGFEHWQTLTNPDVYVVRIKDEDSEVERIWSTY
ncbi:histidine phosphatase family protein [Sporosarcina sp. ANT_H38]|uniref:histidine phosphatase family protein n=1 Tax=Sporosarcina sp. ANT_H38 TaxID=2597358 RepID=UPI0011F155A9|nr:histidine phosphatase family protein [Sporosarcina sp. ANT_H38]KAA0948675.1 histidine phosphatase family protein [Sporosarcina sp. ANT_H38]